MDLVGFSIAAEGRLPPEEVGLPAGLHLFMRRAIYTFSYVLATCLKLTLSHQLQCKISSPVYLVYYSFTAMLTLTKAFFCKKMILSLRLGPWVRRVFLKLEFLGGSEDKGPRHENFLEIIPDT